MKVSKKDKKIKKNLRKEYSKKDFEEIKDQICSIIAKVAKVDRAEIKEDVNIRDKLGVESLDAMEILAEIEARFNIKIDTPRAFEVVTIKDFYKLIVSYLTADSYRMKK